MTRRHRTAKGSGAEPKGAVTLAPTSWDVGATGPANRAGMVLEDRGHTDLDGKRKNPNGVKGVRRVDNLEDWHSAFISGILSRAWITTEQFNAAVSLRNAYETTLKAPGTDYGRPKVDSSPKPDHAVMIQIDRISAYLHEARKIHPADRNILWHCVILDQPPATLRVRGRLPFKSAGGMLALRHALTRLAR